MPPAETLLEHHLQFYKRRSIDEHAVPSNTQSHPPTPRCSLHSRTKIEANHSVITSSRCRHRPHARAARVHTATIDDDFLDTISVGDDSSNRIKIDDNTYIYIYMKDECRHGALC